MSRIGVINDCTLSERDIHIPRGIPIARHKRVAVAIIVTVEIIGVHMSRNPIAKKPSITPLSLSSFWSQARPVHPHLIEKQAKAWQAITVQIELKRIIKG
jgi:hypothetical protein